MCTSGEKKLHGAQKPQTEQNSTDLIPEPEEEQKHFNNLPSNFTASSPKASANMFTSSNHNFHKVVNFLSDGKYKVSEHSTIKNKIRAVAEKIERMIREEEENPYEPNTIKQVSLVSFLHLIVN